MFVSDCFWWCLAVGAVAVVAVALFGVFRVRRVSVASNSTLGEKREGRGALAGLSLRSAEKGVSRSFAPPPPQATTTTTAATAETVGSQDSPKHWWLNGDRLDTAQLFQLLGREGIHTLCTVFYSNVYSDTAEDGWFRDLFRRRASLRQSIWRLEAFLLQMWGDPSKPYTAGNQPHCLRTVVKDHAGAKMFAMHDVVRREGSITEAAAARWWAHMNDAIEEVKPSWTAQHGAERARSMEKTVRWFLDHVLERMVWGAFYVV